MILIVYGTRPELIKIKPLLKAFKRKCIPYKLLFTGQHRDLVQYKYDYTMKVNNGQNRLDSIVSSVCEGVLSGILTKEPLSHVLVQGDTTTAMAVALSAFNHNIKVIHLEAGLRTYDNNNPYPEEQNRRIIGQVASIHLCPTEGNKRNLEKELIHGRKYVVGNTVLDSLLPYKKDCSYDKNILVTLHRRENHANIKEWFTAINNLAKEAPQYVFAIPLHPNPEVRKHKDLLTCVNVVAPMDHSDLIRFLIKCSLVITDSGGLQEECSYFNKKCLVCREETERPESIGTTSVMVGRPEELALIFKREISSPEVNAECPFGDGHAAERIAEILQPLVGRR